jgi:hypothetical protein
MNLLATSGLRGGFCWRGMAAGRIATGLSNYWMPLTGARLDTPWGVR